MLLLVFECKSKKMQRLPPCGCGVIVARFGAVELH